MARVRRASTKTRAMLKGASAEKSEPQPQQTEPEKGPAKKSSEKKS